MADIRSLSEGFKQRVGCADGNLLVVENRAVCCHDSMASETNHFVADGVLESKNDRYGDYHDGDADCHAEYRNTYRRQRDAFCAVRGFVYPPGYVE